MLHAPLIRVSENLTIDLIGGKLHFNMHGNIESLKKDVEFLQAVLQGHTFWVGDKQVTEYFDMKISESLQKNMDSITDFYHALKEIDFTCDKKIDDFDDKNWEAVARLINLYHRSVKLKEGRNNEWRMWWWDGKVVPLLVVLDENEEIQIVNWIAKALKELYIEQYGFEGLKTEEIDVKLGVINEGLNSNSRDRVPAWEDFVHERRKWFKKIIISLVDEDAYNDVIKSGKSFVFNVQSKDTLQVLMSKGI